MAQLVKNPPAVQRPGFDPWVGKIPWRRERLLTPVFWPGEFHGLYRPWDRKESDMTEQLSLHFLQWCKVSLQLYSSACGCLAFLAPFVEETILFPLSGFGILVRNNFTVYSNVCFWSFHSVSLIYMSVFMPERYCFDYHSFVIHFEIRKCESLT